MLRLSQVFSPPKRETFLKRGGFCSKRTGPEPRPVPSALLSGLRLRLAGLIPRAALGSLLMALHPSADENTLQLNLRSRARTADGFSVAERKVSWQPKKTALIICDMWDDHWCKSAARRVDEMAGPLNEV